MNLENCYFMSFWTVSFSKHQNMKITIIKNHHHFGNDLKNILAKNNQRSPNTTVGDKKGDHINASCAA